MWTKTLFYPQCRYLHADRQSSCSVSLLCSGTLTAPAKILQMGFYRARVLTSRCSRSIGRAYKHTWRDLASPRLALRTAKHSLGPYPRSGDEVVAVGTLTVIDLRLMELISHAVDATFS